MPVEERVVPSKVVEPRVVQYVDVGEMDASQMGV